MRKLALVVMFLSALLFITSSLQAKAIGLYGGWAFMQDDYEEAKIDDTWTAGLFFDVGSVIFDSLKFRPGFSYLELDNPDVKKEEVEVYAIHLDWYWFFMGDASFSPFIGFGAALNYYEFGNDNRDEDSDAGLEGFIGFDYWVTGSVAIQIQGRYLWHDIANREQNIAKVLGGVVIKF